VWGRGTVCIAVVGFGFGRGLVLWLTISGRAGVRQLVFLVFWIETDLGNGLCVGNERKLEVEDDGDMWV